MTDWNFCPQCRSPLEGALDDRDRPLSCPEGHFTKYDNPLPSTIAIIRRDDGHLLLLKRARAPKRGAWDAVGGFIDGAESPEECVTREGREEIGLDITPRRIIGVFPSVYGETRLKTLGIAFECDLEHGTITLSDENADFDWFAPEHLPELAFPDVASAFAAFVQLGSDSS
jgi:NAD+ diphosphatase